METRETITLDARAQHRLFVLNHVLTGGLTAPEAARVLHAERARDLLAGHARARVDDRGRAAQPVQPADERAQPVLLAVDELDVVAQVRPDDARPHDLGLATDRIRAAVEAKRALPFPFTLTARAENFLVGIPDLKDTIRRLQAYQEAGADVLYAPCITTREEITTVVKSVDRPVNFLMGTQPQRFTLEELSGMGVRRVSVGSALSAAALGAFLRAAREMRTTGTFTYTQEAAGFGEISKLLS